MAANNLDSIGCASAAVAAHEAKRIMPSTLRGLKFALRLKFKMTIDRLVALPVAGESFLLNRGGKTVLVDGGHSSKPLAKELKAYDPEMDRIDIVVCTHADGDHAGGLGNLIDESGLEIGEFWLPGQWIDSIEDLLITPRIVADGLVRELDEIAQEFPHRQHQEGAPDSLAAILDKNAVAERRRHRSNQRNQETPNGRPSAREFDRLRDECSDIPEDDKAAKKVFEAARQRVQYRRHSTSPWLRVKCHGLPSFVIMGQGNHMATHRRIEKTARCNFQELSPQ